MNEDCEVIQMVDENFSKTCQEEARVAARLAREFADRERLVLCISRMLISGLVTFIVMYATLLAAEYGLLDRLLILLASLYIGYRIGRFSKEVR